MKIFGFLLETAPYVFWIAHPTGYPTYRSFSIKKILYNICLLCLGLSVYLLLPILTILATMEYYFEIYKINFPWVIIFVSIAGFVAGFRKAGVFNIFCLILLLSTLGFSLRYQNAALERYFLTSLLFKS